MKHKFITCLLLLMAAVALLSTTAFAEKDAVDRFADDLRAYKTEIIVPVRDHDALLQETFSRYPELCIIYAGGTYSVQSDGIHVTPRYSDRTIDLENTYVVDTYDEYFAAVTLGYLNFDQPLKLLCTNGFMPDLDMNNALVQRMTDDYYLIHQGFKTWEYTDAVAWERFGVAYYEMNFLLWDEATPELIRFWRQETEAKVLELCSTILPQDMPDYEKLFVIHDYLVDNSYYNMDDINIQRQWINHVAYGTLCAGYGVCQSYAEATRILCDAVGIPCYYVTGDAGGAHAWNIVQLQGEWYLIDTTWDDPVTGDGSNVKLYDYFVITSEQMQKDHTWEYADFPVCTSTELNYDKIVELMAADETVYTDFDTSGIRTLSVMEAELLAMLGTQETSAVVEEEEPPVEDEEEPVVEDEQPVEDEEEPPVEDEEEPPVEDEQDPDAEEEQEPVDRQEEEKKDDPLEEIVILEKDKDKEKTPVSLSTALIVALVVIVLCAGITLIVVNCIANSRVMTARKERSDYRSRHVSQTGRTRSRRF